jgi:hypothetical protein
MFLLENIYTCQLRALFLYDIVDCVIFYLSINFLHSQMKYDYVILGQKNNIIKYFKGYEYLRLTFFTHLTLVYHEFGGKSISRNLLQD